MIRPKCGHSKQVSLVWYAEIRPVWSLQAVVCMLISLVFGVLSLFMLLYSVSQKSSHLLPVRNFVKSYDTVHLTLGVLLH